jgi:thioredoxin-dependent peroxiredoxin
MGRFICSSRIDVGSVAPDFSLPSQFGESVQLADFKGKKWVVLYFYPKDNTRYCIVESSQFRDQYQSFTDVNAVILGVSSDSRDSHVQFATEYQLPFQLLSDQKNKVRKLYGVPATFGIIPGRVTFVIDPAGVVRHKFSSQFNPKSHVEQALRAIRELS